MSDKKEYKADISIQGTLPIDGLKFDYTGAELREYLSLMRKGQLDCPVCSADKWGNMEYQFEDGEYKCLPDSISPDDYHKQTDIAERDAQSAVGNYNFICGDCGYTLVFNALFLAHRFKSIRDDKKKSNE